MKKTYITRFAVPRISRQDRELKAKRSAERKSENRGVLFAFLFLACFAAICGYALYLADQPRSMPALSQRAQK